eukprot:CAMPEP_0197560446 /NCGR_PEP_ID=MMETSP1320-20131121/23174_1 /TAXON_ID=91990 /ORGANISM="Bolidomonas sp., Strain RCC2347" /LENGTH=45 /DNA_ID= /DNA_START= /DNA_END= /DNA_ORIENTATION=
MASFASFLAITLALALAILSALPPTSAQTTVTVGSFNNIGGKAFE